MENRKKLSLIGVAVLGMVIIAAAAYYLINGKQESPFASGNGRIEMTEVDIAAKFPGKVVAVTVHEGDFVKPGQLLARMDTRELNARLKQAKAQVEQARQGKKLADAVVAQRLSEKALAQKNLERSKSLYVNKNISVAQLQQHETALESVKAALEAAKAQVLTADAAIEAAKAQVETIKTNLADAELTSPVDGRVLYRLVEPGELVGAGSRVLTLLKPTEAYMTIFLPTAQVGRVSVGSDARIVLDAAPQFAIPAKVSFISPEAQFTPKSIETQTEREKLMFRVKVKIDADLIKKHLEQAKTGLPGVAYVRLDATTPWPPELNRLPESGK